MFYVVELVHVNWAGPHVQKLIKLRAQVLHSPKNLGTLTFKTILDQGH